MNGMAQGFMQMPEMTPEAAMGEAQSLGMEEQMAADNLFSTAAPTGRFSANALNAVVEAFNEVLVSVGIPDPYPEFQQGQRTLPGQFVRGLAMVADLAEQTGVPNPVDLSNVKDDTDLNLLAARLEQLATNEKFVVGATGGATEEPIDEGATEEMEGAEVPDTDVDDDTDALFMDRM